MKKQDNRATEEKKNSFTVLMTALSVILLAFFILLNAIATLDQKRIKLALGSLAGTFHIHSGGVRPSQGNQPYPRIVVEMGVIENFQNMMKILYERNLGDKLHIEESAEGLSLIFEDRIFFRLGSAEIDPDAIPVLDAVARIIAQTDKPVRIEGHTDDLPIHTRQYPSNWELSTARAVNILRYFIEDRGISPERLSAAGYSQYAPRVPNDNNENRAKNRRVTIVILKEPLAIVRQDIASFN
ncbi:MAG: OmpA family protein [Deltaproteobacteria bacterium]|nr:OmpA family protein [Deltaproteobacteria bacterium]